MRIITQRRQQGQPQPADPNNDLERKAFQQLCIIEAKRALSEGALEPVAGEGIREIKRMIAGG